MHNKLKLIKKKIMNIINQIFIIMKEILKIYLVVEIILVIIWMKKMEMVELEVYSPLTPYPLHQTLDNHHNHLIWEQTS